MTKDLDYIARLERAISRKYGKETILNPQANWSEDKEKDYLLQLKKLDKKDIGLEKVESNGVLVPKKLINKEVKRICPVCQTYSFDIKDDVYMAKYNCCSECYIQYVEDREDRWQEGWRPETGDN